MHLGGEPRRQARLADPRLTGEGYQAAVSARDSDQSSRSRRSGAARPTNGRCSARANSRGSGTGGPDTGP